MNENNNIPVKKMMENVVFMVRYAARYDRPLIVRIIILFVLLRAGSAVNDTFILRMIINSLTGKTAFSEIVWLLLISLVLVVCIEWISQLLNEWSKAKLIGLGGRIQRDLEEKNSRMDLIYYDDPDNYDTYVVVANSADTMIEKTVMITSKMIGGAIALVVASALIMSINPILAIFPVAGFIVNLLTRFKIENLLYTWEVEYMKSLRKAEYSKRVFYQPEYAKECKLTDHRMKN